MEQSNLIGLFKQKYKIEKIGTIDIKDLYEHSKCYAL